MLRRLRRRTRGRVERVIVHIGSDKAGSTAIQHSLHANRPWYREHGVHVPEPGMTYGNAWRLVRDREPDALDALVAERVASPTVVLSWEGIHRFDEQRRRWLGRLLDQAYPGATLTFVYYVRNQVDLLQSGMLQRVKSLTTEPSHVMNLNQPLDLIPASSRRFLTPPNREFCRRLDEWRLSFPDAAFVVRLFDRDRLVGGDVVDDFHEVLGVGGRTGFRRASRFGNPSLTAEAAFVLDEAMSGVDDDDERKHLIDTALAWPGGSGTFLHEDTRAAVTEFFRADNVRLVDSFPECAGIEVPRSKARPDIDPAGIAACERFVAEQRDYPTLPPGAIQGGDLDRLHLVSGWTPPHEVGAWTVGPRSVIRLRAWSPRVTGFTVGLALALRGHYAGSRTETDEVIVNGRSHGRRDLRDGRLFVDIGDLDHTLDLEIELHHHGVDSADERSLQLGAFRLEPRWQRDDAAAPVR